nr:MAG TPA: hypothetical protein [Caudoviricetes sp.]
MNYFIHQARHTLPYHIVLLYYILSTYLIQFQTNIICLLNYIYSFSI